MPLLSLDPAPIVQFNEAGLLIFRDNVQLNYNKIQDIVNKLDSVNITDGSITTADLASNSVFSGIAVARAALAYTSTASTVYVDVPGPYDIAFTKRQAAAITGLDLTVTASCYGTSGSIPFFGLRIGGVDYDVAQFCINTATNHEAFTGFAVVGVGVLAAGNYVARVRWKTGAGTINSDGNDVVCVRIQEITPT